MSPHPVLPQLARFVLSTPELKEQCRTVLVFRPAVRKTPSDVIEKKTLNTTLLVPKQKNQVVGSSIQTPSCTTATYSGASGFQLLRHTHKCVAQTACPLALSNALHITDNLLKFVAIDLSIAVHNSLCS
jgi:hypothetical protein